MDNTESNSTADRELDGAVATVADDELVDELLIEEISIDGMCGVY